MCPRDAFHLLAEELHRENLTAMLALALTFTDPAATRALGEFVANTIVRPEGGRRGVARARQEGTLTLRSKKHTGQPLGVCSLSVVVRFAFQLLAWFAVLAVLMSFLEHQIHRRLMHRKNFLSSRLLSFNKMFGHHAILHHGHYSKIFNDKPVAAGEDRHLRLSIREGFLEALPIAALLGVISLEGAIIFEIVVCLHHFIWNKIHLEMHKPEKRFFSDWPAYKFLARYHYLHHRHPDKNFNVVLPLADYVLGTNIRASNSDLNGMHGLGLL